MREVAENLSRAALICRCTYVAITRLPASAGMCTILDQRCFEWVLCLDLMNDVDKGRKLGSVSDEYEEEVMKEEGTRSFYTYFCPDCLESLKLSRQRNERYPANTFQETSFAYGSSLCLSISQTCRTQTGLDHGMPASPNSAADE